MVLVSIVGHTIGRNETIKSTHQAGLLPYPPLLTPAPEPKVRQHPEWFLDELLDLLDSNRFISVHYTTIHRELEHAGISVKKLQIIAKEHDEDLRADLICQMGQYTAEELGFLDEFSKDERTSQRRCGRAKKGKRAVMRGVFVHGWRVSGEGLLMLDGIVTSTVVEGSMTWEKYLYFLEHSVVSSSSIRCFKFI